MLRRSEGQLYTPWLMLAVGSLVGGLALVALLTVPHRFVWLMILLAATGACMSFAGVFAVGWTAGRLDVALATALLGFLLLALSYTVGTLLTSVVLASKHPPIAVVPRLERTGAVVVLAACVEPEMYDPRAFASVLREFDETGVPLPSWSARPMLFAAERARYRAAASFSPARSTCRAIATDLAERLAADSRIVSVDVAWCTQSPRLDQVVARAIESGSRDIVVAHLSVGESPGADRARMLVDAFVSPDPSIRVVYTPPLWGSKAVAELVVRRTLAAMTDRPRERVGVCLVGHGQPDAWERSYPGSTEHETFFHQRLRAHLEDAGVPGGNVRLAWLDWSEPDASETVRHLAALGCELILVVPSSMPVDTLGTLVDLRQAVHFARVPDTTQVVVLDAWGRDATVADELVRLVRLALEEFPR